MRYRQIGLIIQADDGVRQTAQVLGGFDAFDQPIVERITIAGWHDVGHAIGPPMRVFRHIPAGGTERRPDMGRLRRFVMRRGVLQEVRARGRQGYRSLQLACEMAASSLTSQHLQG